VAVACEKDRHERVERDWWASVYEYVSSVQAHSIDTIERLEAEESNLASSHASVISSSALFRLIDPSEITTSQVGHFLAFMTSSDARMHCTKLWADFVASLKLGRTDLRAERMTAFDGDGTLEVLLTYLTDDWPVHASKLGVRGGKQRRFIGGQSQEGMVEVHGAGSQVEDGARTLVLTGKLDVDFSQYYANISRVRWFNKKRLKGYGRDKK